MKLLFVIEQGKPLKFGLRMADNLQIFNKFHRSTRVRTDQDQHKSSVCIHPLLKGIDHSTMVIGDGAWGELASLEKAKKDQRTHPAGYYALKSDPKVSEGQAV